jgi:hypothetical protein
VPGVHDESLSTPLPFAALHQHIEAQDVL